MGQELAAGICGLSTLWWGVYVACLGGTRGPRRGRAGEKCGARREGQGGRTVQ